MEDLLVAQFREEPADALRVAAVPHQVDVPVVSLAEVEGLAVETDGQSSQQAQDHALIPRRIDDAFGLGDHGRAGRDDEFGGDRGFHDSIRIAFRRSQYVTAAALQCRGVMLHGGGPEMIVGCPREIKNNENRVGITPAGAWALTKAGHQVLVERAAGVGSAFSDEDYAAKCAELVDDAAEVWARSDMVVKVKEPLPSEYQYFRDDLVLFTYLHLAPDRDLTDVLLESGIMGIAYETVQLADMSLPLLVPMSEVAGRMSVLVGAHYLAYPNGGLGLLPSGVPGVYPGEILIIGGGIVGINAAKMAAGLGARAIILDVSAERMKYLDDVLPANCKTVHSDRSSLEHYLTLADLVVGAVLGRGHPGAHAGHARDAAPHEASLPWWSTWPWTRADVSRLPTPPLTRIRCTTKKASSTMPSPICPAPTRAPPRWRSPT